VKVHVNPELKEISLTLVTTSMFSKSHVEVCSSENFDGPGQAPVRATMVAMVSAIKTAI
jgi:hypothetical protein